MQAQTKKSRRTFIKNVAVLAAMPGLTIMEKEKQQIIHHVFFWLKHPGAASEKELMEGLKRLSAIPQVRKLLIGKPASTEKREVVDNSFHVSELMYFDSIKDKDDYQVHPIHKAFVEKYGHLWEKVVVYDMILDTNP